MKLKVTKQYEAFDGSVHATSELALKAEEAFMVKTGLIEALNDFQKAKKLSAKSMVRIAQFGVFLKLREADNG